MEPRRIEKGETIIGYAGFLAHELFQNINRATGLPYTQEA